ncbi:hypothetical protein BGZ94_007489 [Podila epigama]|nr:hypothetical protein BGZ94_007489 [Podila epigama]
MAPLFQGFQGKIVKRGDEAYDKCVYQYAWSSLLHKSALEPEAILYAKGDDDVIAAIKYAKFQNVAIAVRTGGHQYCGASSTYGRNIQLDLSSTYTSFHWEDANHSQVTLGISVDLGTFQGKLKEKGRFLPMGMCPQVHLGGHVQTGGHGNLVRSFGLLSDHVQKIRIITADGEIRWVERGRAKDEDLFFAIMGGSPGNFGVVTDVTLNVHKDEDHPKSRGLRAMFLYSEATFKRILDVMVGMAETPDTPGDYDLTISVLGPSPAEGRPGIIVTFAHWANLEGPNQPYDPRFFEDILEAGGGADKAMPFLGIFLNGSTLTPMSELASHWMIPGARSFPFPFNKHTYMSNSSAETLQAKGWTSWAAGRVQELAADPSSGCLVGGQFQYCGGIHSRFKRNARRGAMSHSWRDSNFVCVFLAPYDVTSSKDARERSQSWMEKNDSEGVGHPEAKFSEQDRRVLWGSYDMDLPAAREFYFDSPEKYERLSAIKQQYDPSHVFTANKFCIGPLPARVLEADKMRGQMHVFSEVMRTADRRAAMGQPI